MNIILLIFLPLLFALLFVLWDNKSYYKTLSLIFFIASVILSINIILVDTQFIALPSTWLTIVEDTILICEVLILAFLFWVSVKHKRWTVFALSIVQTILFVYSEFFTNKSEVLNFNIDKFSIVMLLIVNVIGSLIVVFSNGYISHYEHHNNLKSKQKLYYSVIFIFLSAMNGLIISDSLSMLYFFWEITTLASFILISYNRDTEAYKSGFRALTLNLLGGLCMSIGIILCSTQFEIYSLSEILKHSGSSTIFIAAILLLCIAGFVKSAQMPFQSWLLGAMVAPTPVSALLHSSTMVNAGVYLIVKLSPAYAGTPTGTFIAFVGGYSFLVCSALAVSQRNAKRILAYSTIANLGLIIASAGLGTTIAVSSAIILIIFHAISKALLFLCAGQIEHTIGSRDIEEMKGLIQRSPFVAFMAAFGIISMILPPFGVLVTKWLSLEAAAQNPFLTFMLVLGSALTTVFWVKWLGTLLSYPQEKTKFESHLDYTIKMPLAFLGAAILVTSVFLTNIFNSFVAPEISQLFNASSELHAGNGMVYSNLGTFDATIVFAAVIATVIVYFVSKLFFRSKPVVKNVYMCGENNLADDNYSFRNANGSYSKAEVSNLYLGKVFDETHITRSATIVASLLIIIAFIGGLV